MFQTIDIINFDFHIIRLRITFLVFFRTQHTDISVLTAFFNT